MKHLPTMTMGKTNYTPLQYLTAHNFVYESNIPLQNICVSSTGVEDSLWPSGTMALVHHPACHPRVELLMFLVRLEDKLPTLTPPVSFSSCSPFIFWSPSSSRQPGTINYYSLLPLLYTWFVLMGWSSKI